MWSSDGGRRRPTESAPPPPSKRSVAASGPRVPDDGVVRVARTKSGRGGKTVTVVTGVPEADRGAVLSELKRRCGTGGALKDDTIELQGDQRERVAAALEDRYRVKLAGG